MQSLKMHISNKFEFMVKVWRIANDDQMKFQTIQISLRKISTEYRI